MNDSLEKFIREVPKAELHLHIEGSLEPELMFKLAQRNKIDLKFKSVQAIRDAYQFSNLQDFLNIYYEGAGVLVKEQDFYDLTWEYLEKAKNDNIRHCELFFDPQTHTDRGISFDVVFNGIHQALVDAKGKLGITSELILCFLRHLSEEEAFKTLEQSIPYLKHIKAVGLDSSEVGNPPSKFKKVFAKASELGLLTVAHAGEEGSPDYIWEALDLLNVKRIDHGVRCLEDEKLVERLVREKIPLTVCPYSNIKLKIFDRLEEHNFKKLLDKNIVVVINSDDPAYFGGYLTENYLGTARALKMSLADIAIISKNSFRSSFLSENEIKKYENEIDELKMKFLGR